MPTRPLPRNKIVPDAVVQGFCPAPLDELSFLNGLVQFDHPQSFLKTDAIPYVFRVLDTFFPELQANSQLLCNEEIANVFSDPLHANKSAGFPFSALGAGTKKLALDKFGVANLLDYYDTGVSVLSSTLKQEIRKVHKDARLFRPQDAASYCQGLKLFYAQNEYLMDQLFRSPLFVRFTVPGNDILRLFHMHGRLPRHFAADGIKWDAHFPLVIAQLLCKWKGGTRQMKEYYRRMYNGLTEIRGKLYALIGQPSGHILTTIDNGLCHIVVFALYAFSLGLSLQEFFDHVVFHDCGDDLLWSTDLDAFSPVNIDRFYKSLGIGLEFESWDSMPLNQLSFVGVQLHERLFKGTVYMLYVGRTDKLMASIHFRHKSMNPKSYLSKLCSIAQLLFAREDLFELVCNFFHNVARDYVERGILSATDPDLLGWKASLNPERLIRQMTGFERSGQAYYALKSEWQTLLK